MKGYLLDTHVLLWWLSEPSNLSHQARSVIRDGENSVWVSAAAVWEMSIKKALGRLDMPANLAEVLHGDGIDVLAIGIEHALAVSDLPLLHGDPFDRMQIAQAQREQLVLVTRDARIQQYDVACLPA